MQRGKWVGKIQRGKMGRKNAWGKWAGKIQRGKPGLKTRPGFLLRSVVPTTDEHLEEASLESSDSLTMNQWMLEVTDRIFDMLIFKNHCFYIDF